MKLAFVFPGQGSQYVGMGKEIFERFPVARETFAEASAALGYDVAHLSFSGPAEELNRTHRTQPCILTTSIAVHRVLREMGIRPAVVAGHSLGEYSALVAAEALTLAYAVTIAEKRGLLMQEAVPEGEGIMAAIIGLGRETTATICAGVRSGYVAPANYNCPGQIVIAGERKAVMEAIERCKAEGAKRAVPLAVSVPSHCRLMNDAARRLADVLNGMPFRDPSVPLVNNADARFISGKGDIKESLVRQLNHPVLWEDSMRAIMDAGFTVFVEVGPGKVLAGLMKRIDAKAIVYSTDTIDGIERVEADLRGSD